MALRGIAISAQVYGTLAHGVIEASIEAKFPGQTFVEVPVPGGEIDVVIVSPGLAHLYEIKPLGGRIDPTKQINRYLAALGSSFGGFPLIPGTLTFSDDIRGPLLLERIKYNTAGAGIIYYEPYFPNNNFSLSPVPVPFGALYTITLVAMVAIAVLVYAFD